MRIEALDNQELLDEEIKKVQDAAIAAERAGKIPEPMPDEKELRQRVIKLRQKQILQWRDEKFDEFRRKMGKSHSLEQIDRRAQDFIEGNNCVILKPARRRITKTIFNLSRINSTNLQLMPQYARFIGILSQYFPDCG